MNPLVAVFLGWLLLGEPITPRTLAASAIFVTTVIMTTTQKSHASKLPSK